MKKSTLFLPLALVLFMPHQRAAAQSTFEGAISWTMSLPAMDEESHSMVMNIKGDKSEAEMDMGVQGLIKTYTDRAKKKMYIVMTAMKMGMVTDIKDDDAPSKDAKDLAELKPTGQKTTVAGHPAEEYLFKSAKGEVSIWAASDFPADIREGFRNQLGHNPGQDSKQGHAFKQIADKGLVPVKIVMKEAGEVQMSMEFVKLEQKKMDDALFVPPTDIKFSPMPKMGGE